MALVLFISALFVFILPMIRESMLEHKREMCRALSESGWSVLKYYHERESAGELTRDEAQARAMAEIGSMRYGPDMKDYFWITDMHPRLVMHPYRSDLVDIDLTEFTDQDGKLFFMEFVSVVEESGAGYVDYVWQWQDDPDITSHKFSYVKHFEPWGWILGTGIYLEDVTEHINRLNARLVLICTAILILVSALLVYTVLQSLRTEAQRRRAELATEQYARRLQAVIGSTPEGFWMIDSDLRTVDVNEALTRMLG